MTSEHASRSRSGWVATRRSRAATNSASRPSRCSKLEAALDRCESLLLQAGCLDRRKGRVTEIGERVAAPEVERLAERRDGGGRLLGSGSLDEVLEASDVQLVRVEVEGVAGGVRHDPPGPERLAEPVHADRQRVRRRLGRSLAPESVDESGP